MISVITGPMWASKSSRLLVEIEREETFRKGSTHVFKPWIDSRDGAQVKSHDGAAHPAEMIEGLGDIFGRAYEHGENVFVDEAQFLEGVDENLTALLLLSASGTSITFAGLDLDFRGRPFPAMSLLLSVADSVRKKHARCAVDKCFRSARFTQRLRDGFPCVAGGTIQIGGGESYEPRCKTHFVYG